MPDPVIPPATQTPQILFEDVDGRPAPRLPKRPGERAFRAPDGVRLLSLAQAAGRWGRTEASLRDEYLAVFGDMVEPETVSIVTRPVPGAGPDDAEDPDAVAAAEPPRDPVVARAMAAKHDLLHVLRFPHLSAEQFEFVLQFCRVRGLNAWCGQVWAETRHDHERGLPTVNVITTLAGLLAIADGTGKYEGLEDPLWCGTDGQWAEVWVMGRDQPPFASRAGVFRRGAKAPIRAVANWDFYAPYFDTDDGPQLNRFWRDGGPHMLHKCATALALRLALPQNLGGLYTVEEMQQAKADARSGRRRDRGVEPPPGVRAFPATDAPEADAPRRPVAATGDDEEVPTTPTQFEIRLAERGIHPQARRHRLTQEFIDKWPTLYQRSAPAFYARVLQTIDANPAAYRGAAAATV